MIAKISKSKNLYGALAYNQLKVTDNKAKIILINKMIESSDGNYSVAQLARSFAPHLIANRNTEKTALHISINPDPKDKVNEEMFKAIAAEYIEKLGYGEQPYIVFSHSDINRSHIHIVSVCVDQEGKKIPDQFEKKRSMAICRALERKYNLINASDRKEKKNSSLFIPVDYNSGDIKSQMASVIRHIHHYYKFQTLGEYNALLSLFNITVEKIEKDYKGEIHQGLLYSSLNEKGEKTGPPFKASLFGKNAGLSALEKYFTKCNETLKNHPDKQKLKAIIMTILKSEANYPEFIKQLTQQEINLVIRRNDSGHIYGITFIDHNSKIVWNGSRLGKELSANAFNNYWNTNSSVNSIKSFPQIFRLAESSHIDLPSESPHQLFDFLNTYPNKEGLISALGNLLPEVHNEDFEEIAFANKMKKRMKRRKNM